MPRLTAAHFVARKEQILKAAYECLASTGYARLTVRDIAAAAGISVGTLYLHFDDKREIVKALVEQERALDEAALEGISVAGGPLEALGALFEFLIERLDHPGSVAALRVDVELWAEAIHDPAVKEMFHDSQGYWIDRLSGLIEEAQQAGQLPPDADPASLARLCVAMFAGLELMKVMQPEVPLGRMAETFRILLQTRLDSDPGSDAG